MRKMQKLESICTWIACSLLVGILILSRAYSTSTYKSIPANNHIIVFEKNNIGRHGGLKIFVRLNGERITFQQAFRLLEDPNSGFHQPFFSTFTNFSAEALFFECHPISKGKFSTQTFEYVILRADALEAVEADCTAFESYFGQHEESVVSFRNLGGDATLVVPVSPNDAPNKGIAKYAHLLAFMRGAEYDQQKMFWTRVAQEAMQVLQSSHSDKNLWISTSGLGVFWLHVRLDSLPKYYNWKPYKLLD